MSVKAKFSAGQTDITVTALHQWDYGQQLEIEAPDIPESIIEVHFACQGMTEAVVHSCTYTGGNGTVPIPDRCLEQPSTITAWVYEVEKVDDKIVKCTTTKTITIPIIARTKPSRGEVPQNFVDTATELIAEVNEVINDLNTGEVIAKHAQTANSAGYATEAGNAATVNPSQIPLVVDEVLTLPVPHSNIVVGYVNSIDLPSLSKTPKLDDQFWGICKSNDNYIYGFVAKITSEDVSTGFAQFEFTEVWLLHDASIDTYVQAVKNGTQLVPNATNAAKATTANFATCAANDQNNNDIQTTYAKISNLANGSTVVKTATNASNIKIGDTYYSLATTTDETSTGTAGVITFVLEA